MGQEEEKRCKNRSINGIWKKRIFQGFEDHEDRKRLTKMKGNVEEYFKSKCHWHGKSVMVEVDYDIKSV